MNIKPIKTNADYEAALKRIEELMDAQKPTDVDELDVLATLVEVSENAHLPIPALDPIEAIKFRMDQMRLKQADLAKILGARSRVSEIFAGKRGLTIRMIRGLHAYLGIPLESLIGSRPVGPG